MQREKFTFKFIVYIPHIPRCHCRCRCRCRRRRTAASQFHFSADQKNILRSGACVLALGDAIQQNSTDDSTAQLPVAQAQDERDRKQGDSHRPCFGLCLAHAPCTVRAAVRPIIHR
jgi:hypothetical protein